MKMILFVILTLSMNANALFIGNVVVEEGAFLSTAISYFNTPTDNWGAGSELAGVGAVTVITNANGNVIWGGFNDDWTVKHIVIPSSQKSIEFNSDGNASSNMESGKVYRWRVYASKNNTQSPTGWELISVSEDQRGLIIIE